MLKRFFRHPLGVYSAVLVAAGAICLAWPVSAPCGEDVIAPPRTSTAVAEESSGPGEDKYPLVVPPAGNLLHMLRRNAAYKPGDRYRTQTDRQEHGYRMPGITTHDPCPSCDRPIPTRSEFRTDLKERPADAAQILRRCDVPVRSLSPIRQLPTATRQLKVDTRQRAADTWPR